MRPRDQVVIVSRPLDMHSDLVIGSLRRHDVEVVRLHLEDLCGGAEFSQRIGPDGHAGELRVLAGGRAVDRGRVRSIWWRRLGEYRWPEGFTEAHRAFAKRELEQALRGLLGTAGCRWVDRPEAIAAASWKPEQLARAAGLGLGVPRSLVTSLRREAVGFFEECGGRIVYKVMGDAFLGGARGPDGPLVTGTRLLGRADLDRLADREPVPCLFQEYVPKERELRVVVVGERVFAAAVTPFLDGEELVDWRGHEAELAWERCALPREIERRCLELTRGYGLRFAAVDLVLTPDGEYVFLELNPAGQFLFLDHLVPGMGLCDAFAAYLAAGEPA